MSDHMLPRADAARGTSNRRRSRTTEDPGPDSSAPRVANRVEVSRSGSVDTTCAKPPLHGQSGAATAWQYTSTQRCLACGKLGCTGCAARVDPEARRQRLEALKMNTPYERAKIQRIVEDVLTDESRRRHKIEEQWYAEAQSIQLAEITQRRLVSLAQQERAYRGDIACAEAHDRQQWALAAELHSVLAALVRHEKEARCAVVSAERTDFSGLAYEYECHRHIVTWIRREATARERLALEEATFRDRLRAVEADGRHTMRSQELERMALHELCLSGRDAIDQEWRFGVEKLGDLAAAHVSVLKEQWAERMEVLAEAERCAVNLSREHEFSLRRLYDDMLEEHVFLEETAQLFAHQRENVVNMEAAARNGLFEEWIAFRHGVFLQFKQDEEGVSKFILAKRQTREQALHEALRYLNAIVEEEADAFQAIIAVERRGRDYCDAISTEKACLREDFIRRWLMSAEQLQQEEEQARRALYQQRQRDAVGVADWIVYKERQRGELLSLACDEKAEITKDEHQARFFIVSSMAEHEEGVRRWCSRKAQAQDEVILQEVEQRQQGVSLEELARETLTMLFNSHMERLGTLAQQRGAQLVALQQHCQSSAEAIHSEEAEARGVLYTLHHRGLHTAVQATEFREQVELLQQETAHRSLVVQEEISSRDAVRLHANLSLRCHEDRAAALHQERVHQLESSEYNARQLFYVDVGECFEHVYMQQRQEELELLEALENRIAQELASRATAMEEDVRLYDENEFLVFPDEFVTDLGVNGAAPGGLSRGSASMSDLRTQLVLQTLGAPICAAGIRPMHMDILAAVLDVVGTRRAEVTEHVARLEKAAHALQKKVQSAEIQLGNEREKKEDYENRRQRETTERERRLENDQMEKKREMERWSAEKRRLKEAEEELDAQKRALEDLRRNIHRQYKH